LADRLDAMLSVSMTTRPRRPGEVDGREYRFVNVDDFRRRIAEGRMLEYAEVYAGNLYGTPAEPVLEAMAAGRTVILEIEINGTIQVKRRLPEAIGVYMIAPSPEDQRIRIEGRHQDSATAMAERLSKAEGEIRFARECGAYQHFVVNREIEETVDALARIAGEARDRAIPRI
jgi:guanylate kinase